jgi:hypothetical protein
VFCFRVIQINILDRPNERVGTVQYII